MMASQTTPDSGQPEAADSAQAPENRPSPPPAAAQQEQPLKLLLRLAEQYAPGAGAFTGRRRWLYVGVSASLLVLVSVVGIKIGVEVEENNVGDMVAEEDQAQEALDAQKPPFTTTAKRLTEDDQQPDYLIDRPFSSTEVQRLLALNMRDSGDIAEFDSLMEERKARRVNTPSFTTSKPSWASAYQLDILSEKGKSLSIAGLEAKDLNCTDTPVAATVIRFPHQGEIRASEMLLDLDSRPKDPLKTGEGDPYEGQSYFSHYGIAVGGAESPGKVRLEAATGRARCTFKLKALYTDKDGRHSATITDDGKPFIAESSPERPEQEIVFSIPDEAFVDCSERWVSGCSDYWK